MPKLKLLVTFTLFGPVVLTLGWVLDIWSYIYNLYTVPDEDKMLEKEILSISMETLECLESTCTACTKALHDRCKKMRE